MQVAGTSHRMPIKFFIHHEDTPFLNPFGGGFMSSREVLIRPNLSGEWAIPLVQNALVTMHMPEANLACKIPVPDIPAEDIGNIDVTLIDIYRNN